MDLYPRIVEDYERNRARPGWPAQGLFGDQFDFFRSALMEACKKAAGDRPEAIPAFAAYLYNLATLKLQYVPDLITTLTAAAAMVSPRFAERLADALVDSARWLPPGSGSQPYLCEAPERFKLYLRIANPLAHIVATNIGFSLYADRERNTIMLLDNGTNVPFVTADQPVINIAACPRKTKPPERFELYYPLSPTKAMFLLEPSSDFSPGESAVSETFVHLCNLRMAAHSYRQVFSASPRALESVRGGLAAYMSCFSDLNSEI